MQSFRRLQPRRHASRKKNDVRRKQPITEIMVGIITKEIVEVDPVVVETKEMVEQQVVPVAVTFREMLCPVHSQRLVNHMYGVLLDQMLLTALG